MERRIKNRDLVPSAQRQQEEKGILKAIYEYLQDHPWQAGGILLAPGGVIVGFLVAMGLPLLASGATAAAAATTGTAVAGGGAAATATGAVGVQVAGSIPIGYTTVKFVLGVLITMF